MAEASSFALSKGCMFAEVSAKRNDGVQEVFEKLVDDVRCSASPNPQRTETCVPDRRQTRTVAEVYALEQVCPSRWLPGHGQSERAGAERVGLSVLANHP
jgi:hypothetical protein